MVETLGETTTEQREFELDDVRLVLPWGGRSPRELTRARVSFIFKAGAVKKRERIRDPRQLDLFERAVEGPFVYEGVPLLFGLEE